MDVGHWMMRDGHEDTSEGRVWRSVKEETREAEVKRRALWPLLTVGRLASNDSSMNYRLCIIDSGCLGPLAALSSQASMV